MANDGTTVRLLQRLQTQIAAGAVNLNTLIRAGLAGHFHANFDRIEGGQNADRTNDNKRVARLVRPGAIILANLDSDEDPAVVRARFAYNQVDSSDAVVNFAVDDDLDVTEFFVAEPAIAMGNATRINMRVDPADQARIRIWRIDPAAPNLQAGPPNVQVVIGPGVAADHEIHNTAAGPVAAGWHERYVVEAVTLPGDPALPRPAGAPPDAPGSFRTPAPATTGGSEASPRVNATNTNNPIYASRADGDIWIELVHDIGGGVGDAPVGAQADLQEVGLFTIAPWIMTWNTLACERVYVCNMRPAGRRPPQFRHGLSRENQGMVWDLHEACHAAGLAPGPPNVNHTIPHVEGDPNLLRTRNDLPFYVIAQAHCGTDRWAQDEFEIGYCWAPHNWMHVVLHMPRNYLDLIDFPENHMAHTKLGVFESVKAAGGGAGQDCGGNLEVSPPVPNPAPAIARDMGGPSVKAHRAAPFGKIIFGDYHDAVSGADGRAFDSLRNFLVAQGVQPVLPINTSWLSVGHVDEFSTFVRATGSRGFKLLLANVRLMTLILREVLAEDPAATIHAGKFIDHHVHRLGYGEQFVADWVGVPAASQLRLYSERVEREVLARIAARLRMGLDLTEEYVLPIPTYWKVPANQIPALGSGGNDTIAENVGMVNMLVVNNHLMVPRPYGPRLRRPNAEQAMTRILERWFGYAAAPPVSMPPAGNFTFWARPNESVEAIAMYFAGLGAGVGRPWRAAVINAIGAPGFGPGGAAPAVGSPGAGVYGGGPMHGPVVQGAFNGLPVAQQNAITAWVTAIRGANPGPPALPAAYAPFPDWRRINIPDHNTVDILEVYMKSILEHIGNTVHFIEDFESYHEQMGEVHCGTNAKRCPPELESGFVARWWDQGVYDPVDYDTTYNPAA